MTRWVLILSLLAPGLWILDYLVYFAGAIRPWRGTCDDFNNIMGYTVWIPAVAALGSWLLGIVDTLRRGMWGWFVLVTARAGARQPDLQPRDVARPSHRSPKTSEARVCRPLSSYPS